MSNINRDIKRLYDMIDAMDNIQEYHQSIITQKQPLHAILYNITIIGEAANNLSATLKSENTHVEWRDMVSMRNKVIHEYGKVSAGTVESVVLDDIPILKEQIEKILQSIEGK